MHSLDTDTILDREQLREITMDDSDLMQELLDTLVSDTAAQLDLLDCAIREQDPQRTMRLAHYCKGACANVGANSMAALLKRLEQQAAAGEFAQCQASYAGLPRELERLRHEAESL
ncbi:MAG: Hpt domain-containing protein [Candidatus Solibacter sp.]